MIKIINLTKIFRTESVHPRKAPDSRISKGIPN